MKPAFIVLGAPKCGTTSFYHYLNQHPNIFLCPKEVHYFIRNDPGYSHVLCQDWISYKKLFADALDNQVAGEVAVRYLYSQNALSEIKNQLPQTKLIALVRNPVERAFSQFLMRLRTGGGRKLEGGLMPTSKDIDKAFSNMKEEYIQWGRYSHFLKPWYEAFGSENISVIKLENLTSRPDEVLREVFEFIKVDSEFSVDTAEKFNVSTVKDFNPVLIYLKRSRILRYIRNNKAIRLGLSRLIPRDVVDRVEWRKKANSPHILDEVQLPPEIRARLLDYYEDDIRQLHEITGQTFVDWQ